MTQDNFIHIETDTEQWHEIIIILLISCLNQANIFPTVKYTYSTTYLITWHRNLVELRHTCIESEINAPRESYHIPIESNMLHETKDKRYVTFRVSHVLESTCTYVGCIYWFLRASVNKG